MLSKQWETLANYESIELVRRDYHLRHGRTPKNTAHARELAAPISHARAYFRSARNAEQTVKPLLLYYGVVSLTRGLILSLGRGRRESSLAPSHGLSIKEWQKVLASSNPDFTALQVEVNAAGTFVELAHVTQNKSLLRGGSSAVNLTYVNPALPTGAKFTLGDVLARVPSLQNQNMRWRDMTLCSTFTITPGDGPEAFVQIQKADKLNVTPAFGQALFAGTDFTFLSETSDQIIFKGPNSQNAFPGLTDYLSPAMLNIGSLWLTARYPGGLKLSKLVTTFLLAYMLGMLVRYYPAQWTALVRGQIDDAALPTIASAIEYIEIEFPQLILDFLSDRASHL